MISKAKLRYWFGALYVLLLVYLLFFAFFRDSTEVSVNLIPIKKTSSLIIHAYTHNVSWSHFIYVHALVLTNLLLFFPIPYLFKLDISKKNQYLISFCIPILVEILQFLFKTGSADIDDILLNALGFLLGFLLLKRKVA